MSQQLIFIINKSNKQFLFALKTTTQINHKLILECIELNEPIILGIWEVKELTNDMAQFVDNLKVYSSNNVPNIHMRRVISNKLQEIDNSEGENLAINKLLKESSLLFKGISEVYKETKDAQEMDTFKKGQKINKST